MLQPNLLVLEVANRDASARWYVENLGFAVSAHRELPVSGMRAAFLERDGFRLEVVERRDGITIKD